MLESYGLPNTFLPMQLLQVFFSLSSRVLSSSMALYLFQNQQNCQQYWSVPPPPSLLLRWLPLSPQMNFVLYLWRVGEVQSALCESQHAICTTSWRSQAFQGPFFSRTALNLSCRNSQRWKNMFLFLCGVGWLCCLAPLLTDRRLAVMLWCYFT